MGYATRVAAARPNPVAVPKALGQIDTGNAPTTLTVSGTTPLLGRTPVVGAQQQRVVAGAGVPMLDKRRDDRRFLLESEL